MSAICEHCKPIIDRLITEYTRVVIGQAEGREEKELAFAHGFILMEIQRALVEGKPTVYGALLPAVDGGQG